MRSHFSNVRGVVSVGLTALLFGCPPPKPTECITGDEEVCDTGKLPDDVCNSLDEALAGGRCAVQVGAGCPAASGPAAVALEGYISTLSDGSADTDWYLAQMPAGLTPRCLLHVQAAYSAPQTAVNLLVNVLQDDGVKSVASGIDRHGAAAPKPVDLIVPFSQSSARLLVQLADEGATMQRKVDNRNPYQLLVEIIENPDPNEPNDMTPTDIPLAAMGSGQTAQQQGTTSGYLATNDDVDRYTFTVAGGGRQIVYVRISAPAMSTPLLPALAYRMSYVLLDPAGVPVSEGVMDNEFLQIDLATARLATPGTYTIIVQGYKTPGQATPAKGDLRVRYDVDVRVLPDLDTREPNDTPATAPIINVAPGSLTVSGRMSYVADEEWFKLVVPPGSSVRTLRYAFSSGGVGRFPPLSPIPSRQVRLATEVTTGVTQGDRVTNCSDRANICPRSFTDKTTTQGVLVTALCQASDPPHCLWAERNEEDPEIAAFRPLKNFVGAVPVPAAGQTFLLLVRDQGKGKVKYADDADWTMQLSLEDDADEQSRLSGPTRVQLGAAQVEATGVISYGHGELLDLEARLGQGIRGPNDYDAYVTDKDMFEFAYPINAQGDQSWGLEWVLGHGDAGSPPADLAFEVAVCGSPLPLPDGGGLCQAARQIILAASDDPITPWYLPVTNGNQRMLFTKSVQANSTTITATPAACYCVGATRVQTGRFYVNVAGINRKRNEPLSYRLRQTIAPYPAGNLNCPVMDGGCRFTPP